MSAHVVVIATDLRRATIKVTSGTYLIDVLQQACQKLNLSSDKYTVKNKQKQVDLSVPFRASGLVSGAKLELVQKSNTPSAIQVALQIPYPESKEIPGGRLIHKFPSNLTIWKVLRQFESGNANQGRNLNITARGVAQMSESGAASGGGQLFYEIPVLNIMGRELASFVDFQKTLSQLGYNSGSVLIRLTYKRSEQTLYEAMEEISRSFRDDGDAESETKPSQAAPTAPEQAEALPTTEDTAMADVHSETVPPSEIPVSEAQPSEPEALTNNGEPALSNMNGEEVPDSINQSPYKPAHVYLAPSGDTPAAASAPVNEADYVPSVAHAQLHQNRLQDSSRNKRLPSDKELAEKAAAEKAKIDAVKFITVKVRFPDNTSSDWQVGPTETGAFLYEAVRHVMANDDQPFRLVLPGTKDVIKDESGPRHNLIKGYKLAGRVLINLVWDDSVKPDVRKRPFLKANVAKQGEAIPVPDLPQSSEDKDEKPAAPPAGEKTSKGEGGGTGLPKWFKMGKK